MGKHTLGGIGTATFAAVAAIAVLVACGTASQQDTLARCPAETPFAPPSLNADFFYVLIDQSPSYAPLTATALDRLVDSLRLSVSPGDRIMASWIGSNSFEPVTTFFSEEVALAQVQSPPFDAQEPNTPSPNAASTAHRAYCRNVEAYNGTVQAYNTAVAPMATQVENEAALQVEDFMRRAESLRTATPPEGESGTGICEGLLKAGEVLSSPIDGREYAQRKLLIFSDLEEFPRSGLEKCSSLSLPDVTVVVALFHCPNQLAVECPRWAEGPQRPEEVYDIWSEILERAGANVPDVFLRPEVSNPETIAHLLR